MARKPGALRNGALQGLGAAGGHETRAAQARGHHREAKPNEF